MPEENNVSNDVQTDNVSNDVQTDSITMDDIDVMIDELSENSDNDANSADKKSEETLTINALHELVTVQDDKIQRLTAQVGRMVTMYGAKLSGDNSSVEDFKSLKVEETFDDVITPDVPSLEEIGKTIGK